MFSSSLLNSPYLSLHLSKDVFSLKGISTYKYLQIYLYVQGKMTVIYIFNTASGIHLQQVNIKQPDQEKQHWINYKLVNIKINITSIDK